MNNLDKAEALRKQFEDDCETLVTNEVKRVMRIHKNLVKYSDTMGLRVFTDNKGESIFLTESRMNANYQYVYTDTYKTFSTLNSMYDTLGIESTGIEVDNP